VSIKTIIAWTDHTFNLAWGCFPVSPGCKNCYAQTLSERYGWTDGGGSGPDLWRKGGPRRTFGDKYWRQPIEWNALAEQEGRVHRVFCSSMCDVFEDHPTITQERAKLWALIRQTPWLDWQLLTKRPERIKDGLPADWNRHYTNVWLWTSVENDDYAWRADELGKIPAAVRFISYEPALGALPSLDLSVLDWVIYGGESGAGYRAHHLEWPRAMRDRCKEAGVAFFFKQSSAIRTEMGTTLDGETIRQFPCPAGRPSGKEPEIMHKV
jgi:protein gp37